MKPWFWWSMAGSVLFAAIYGAAAYYYARKETYPWTVRASGFIGMVRDTAKFTFLGSAGGLVASVMADELEKFPFFQHAMFAVLVVSLVASILNYYMGAALDTVLGHEGKSIKLESPFWVIVHGVIFGLSLGAAIAWLVAVIAIAMRF